ncbi:unnamed protein product [Brassica napus]|uniref:(rape) hypothetical protein n=1 Tax=Brassica napus TaxID=3708 RepID=A0A816SYG7_BRANA|nr:unnamed protein product [Brassica napus]
MSVHISACWPFPWTDPCTDLDISSSFDGLDCPSQCAAQPNSPPDNVLRPDRPAKRVLGLKRRVVTRLRFTDRIPLSVPVLSWLFDARESSQRAVPSPSPADTRRSALATLAGQAARQQSTG